LPRDWKRSPDRSSRERAGVFFRVVVVTKAMPDWKNRILTGCTGLADMRLRDIIDSGLPIIQAPMAGVQLGALAAAVCEAGGLGSLPCALLPVDAMARELDLLVATGKPYNVNFFCHAAPRADEMREMAWRDELGGYYRELGIDPASIASGPGRSPFTHDAADALEKYRPAVVSFHFGLPPDDLLERVKRWGSTILASATTVDEARWLEERGADAIIAQGVEAGGHRGIFLTDDLTTQLGTFALLPQVVAAVKLPVIAAGGIADSRGVKAAMALGASAVQVGTAYLLCPEATTSAIHRAALKSDAARHTALTNLFTGRPARGIVNRVMREKGPLNPAVPQFPLATSAIAPLRAKAEARGSGDFSPLWSGQNASGCREIPAAQLTRELAAAL
jgi:nitronate monooxygenase